MARSLQRRRHGRVGVGDGALRWAYRGRGDGGVGTSLRQSVPAAAARRPDTAAARHPPATLRGSNPIPPCDSQRTLSAQRTAPRLLPAPLPPLWGEPMQRALPPCLPAARHDGDLVPQNVGLLHGVSGQHDGAPRLGGLCGSGEQRGRDDGSRWWVWARAERAPSGGGMPGGHWQAGEHGDRRAGRRGN